MDRDSLEQGKWESHLDYCDRFIVAYFQRDMATLGYKRELKTPTLVCMEGWEDRDFDLESVKLDFDKILNILKAAPGSMFGPRDPFVGIIELLSGDIGREKLFNYKEKWVSFGG